MPTAYREIDQVGAIHNGRPVTLRLQERKSEGQPWFSVTSWRTRYPPPAAHQNRRFYWLRQGGCWTIPVELAVRLLQQATAKGWLDGKYDDRLRGPGTGKEHHFIVSSELDEAGRQRLLREITRAVGEPDWGADPLFVVAEDSTRSWRKVLLVDTRRTLMTFRSCTTDRSYRPVVEMGQGTPWMLDNAMLDCHPQDPRVFRQWLSNSR